MAKSSTKIATRSGPSPMVGRLREELAKATARGRDLRKQVKESKVPNALLGAGEAVGAAAVTGAFKGWYGEDEFAGVPIEAGAGIGLVVAGVALGNEHLIAAGSGPLASYASDWAESKAADYAAGGE